MAEPEDQARQDACAAAERMRSQRVWLVNEVASGTTLDGLFAEPGAAAVRLVVLAEKVPGVGKVRARRAMGALGIGEDARFGEVDPDRLRALWAAMADAATRPI
jgi:hypothetical protein